MLRSRPGSFRSLLWLSLLLVGGAVLAEEVRTLRIAAGTHGSALPGLKRLQLKKKVDRTVSFSARFPAGAAYVTADPANQGDWNKLMGITSNRIHHNSIRLGWRWKPADGVMELGFYGYIRGKRIHHALTTVPLDTWIDVSLRFHNGGLSVTAGSASYHEESSLGLSPLIPTATWILETVYFGGDEKAPHDLAVEVRGIVVK